MKTAHRPRRLAATLLAAALAGTGLTVAAAPAAHAAASDAVAKLPISSYSALAVDSVHQRVYIADQRDSQTNGTVLVYNFQGQKVTTLAHANSVSGLALSADSATLYVGERGRIVTYDTETLAQNGAVTAPYDTCGRQLAFAGGKVFTTDAYVFQSSYCATASTALDMMANGTVGRTGWNDIGRLQLAAGGTNRLLMGQPAESGAANPFLASFDASGETLVRDASRRFADAEGKGALALKDMAGSTDGSKVAVADAGHGTRLLNSGDLSDAADQYQALPTGAKASAVAFSGDGRYVARGAQATGSTPDLLVQAADPTDGTPPLEFVFEGSLDGGWVTPRGLAWSADGSRLFAVTQNGIGTEYWLHVIQPPAVQYDTRFTGGLSNSPAQAVAGEPLAVRGKLEFDGPAPAEPLKVTATRTDANGTHELGTATVKEDGTFTVLDEPDLVGDATYSVSFLGDLTHRPAQDVTHTVSVAKAPTSIALTAPAESDMDTGVEITGKLTVQGKTPAERPVLTVQRTDRLGTGWLTSVTVAADGAFTINDLPRTNRDVTYTVTYAGDDLHEASTASATVLVRR
ncbi:Ig-like domain repeat protein [Streptomyces himalayensis]|uniref:Ig-like domain repeat protein n=1 Tax=Streptomyces himalayensis subsp. himalayensis TaxID=2756131 RepID=A0A7W0DRD4_9ACTN|nr:Ig-like domain repeat protein [Streptomyces himalayensis]MBA2949089.1 Ig-like domain repeat protein [Streptomyces himalayensis subsp. himalayensis]